uniref:Uncharacterized protein n=1 Tax=Arion vulgaris TaxID=1028688 RepID=A0A0B7A2F4_9EUPU
MCADCFCRMLDTPYQRCLKLCLWEPWHLRHTIMAPASYNHGSLLYSTNFNTFADATDKRPTPFHCIDRFLSSRGMSFYNGEFC